MKAKPPNRTARGAPKSGERELFDRLRALVLAARQTVARGVDLVQVHTCFEIGRHLVEHEQRGERRAGYGVALLDEVATRLSDEFGRGFSRSSVALMRSFYLAYAERAQIVQTASGQFAVPAPANGRPSMIQTASGPSPRPFSLSWSHYVFLVGVKSADERSFYEIEAADQGWTLRELKRQFDTSLFERLALSRDKAGVRKLAREGQNVTRPADLLKEPLVLEFLGLDEQARYSESDLEGAVINEIGRFLLELGKGFLFEARQKRFSFDGDHRHSAIGYVSPAQRHAGQDVAILAARHALFLKARDLNPARWSGASRDWSPAGPVTLNPGRDSVVSAHLAASDKQRAAA